MVAWFGRGLALLLYSLRTSILGVTLAGSIAIPIGLGRSLALPLWLRPKAALSLGLRGHHQFRDRHRPESAEAIGSEGIGSSRPQPVYAQLYDDHEPLGIFR